MAVMHSTGIPRERTDTGAIIGGAHRYYHLPNTDTTIIVFYKGMNHSIMGMTFYFRVYDIRQGEHRELSAGDYTEHESLDRWKFSTGMSEIGTHLDTQEILRARGKIIEKLYDHFRMQMGIGGDAMMQQFFFDAAHNALFSDYDRYRLVSPIKPPEPKKDDTPPEVKSALRLHEKGIKLQKEIYKDTVEFQKEVSEHYKKYGTLGQRFVEYLKSFRKK